MAANVIVHSLPALPDALTLAAVAVSGCVLALWQRRIWLLGGALGFIWTVHAADLALAARLPAQLDRSDVRVSGWIDDFPEAAANRMQLSLSIDTAELPMLEGRRIRLSWYDAPADLHVGQQIVATVRLRTPHGYVNPAGFDFERWLLLERFAATGYVRTLHVLGARRAGFAPWLLALRADIRERIAAHTLSTRPRGLVTALAIGERSGFGDQDWEVFRRTGTSHLVAISGLHIGIVALVVLWPARRLFRAAGGWLLERSGFVAAAMSLLFAGLYAGLAGFSVSTLRALIMLAVAMLVTGMLRKVSRFYGLALAALLLTAIDPLTTLGSSFWLSFGAVGTLLLVVGPGSAAARVTGVRGWLQSALRVQLAIAVAAIPAGAVFFGEFSLIAFAVNLFAIPLFSFLLVPGVLLCVFLELIVGAPQWMWDAVAWSANAALATLDKAASVPFASIQMAAPSLTVLLVSIAGVILMLPWHPQRGRFAGTLALAPLIWSRPALLPPDTFRLSVLDVGHGLAAMIETREYLLIYDAGARFDSGFDIGRDVVLPAIQGRRDPQLLIVSHADNDHSGGAAAVLAAYPHLAVLAGPDVEWTNTVQCVAGRRWLRDGIAFELLHPASEFPGRGNDSSCVLRVSGPGGSVLLTGDIERAGEAALLRHADLGVDVVVAPHHGSETSSTAAFVAATSPSIAIFSSAYGNRWDFPRETVVERWCESGATVYVTGEQGALEVTLGMAQTQVVAQRSEDPRYWRAKSEIRCGESPGVTL